MKKSEFSFRSAGDMADIRAVKCVPEKKVCAILQIAHGMDEFIDRFGEPPSAVQGLVDVALLRSYAAQLGIYEIKQQNTVLLIFINELKPEIVAAIGQHFRGRAMISAAKTSPYITLKMNGKPPVDVLKEFITKITTANNEV